jgi:hypothetical protein
MKTELVVGMAFLAQLPAGFIGFSASLRCGYLIGPKG